MRRLKKKLENLPETKTSRVFNDNFTDACVNALLSLWDMRGDMRKFLETFFVSKATEMDWKRVDDSTFFSLAAGMLGIFSKNITPQKSFGFGGHQRKESRSDDESGDQSSNSSFWSSWHLAMIYGLRRLLLGLNKMAVEHESKMEHPLWTTSLRNRPN